MEDKKDNTLSNYFHSIRWNEVHNLRVIDFAILSQ